MYAGVVESDSADARTQFLLLVSAVGCFFGKNGESRVKEISESFEGLPVFTEDVESQLTEQQRLILFGAK